MKCHVFKLVILALVALNIYQWFRWREAINKGDIITTDTVRYYDTILIPRPVPKDSVVIRWITKELPAIPIRDTARKDTSRQEPQRDSTIASDSVAVQIPITQKKYEGKDYKAYVSGYMPQLDSLVMYPESKTVYIKPSRWSIGIQAGLGVSRGGDFSPYIGVGVSYRLFDLKNKR